MIILFGGVTGDGEKAPMESFCLTRDNKMIFDVFCDVKRTENFVYSKFIYNCKEKMFLSILKLISTC